jgi:hypothetical protein
VVALGRELLQAIIQIEEPCLTLHTPPRYSQARWSHTSRKTRRLLEVSSSLSLCVPSRGWCQYDVPGPGFLRYPLHACRHAELTDSLTQSKPPLIHRL